jgi:hypothetical protein
VLDHRFTRALAVVALVAAAPRAAHADAAADRAEANRHFQLGVELYAEGKYDEALVEFERAYEIAPHPLVLYNMAGTQRELSHYGEAIAAYQRFLAEGEGKVSAELLAKGRAELAALEARVGRVTVTVDRDGAQVTVDGRRLGETPLAGPLVLGPGRHTVTATTPGGRSASKDVTLAAGDTAAVEIALGEDPVAAVPAPVDGDATSLRLPVEPRTPRRFALAASGGTNALHVGDTGAALIGVSVGLGGRVSLGVDVVTVAWAVVPSVRVRLVGAQVALHAIVAVPVAFADAGESETFVAGALGLGVRAFVTPRLALRAEALVSVAGDDHGTTVPAFLGAELWF